MLRVFGHATVPLMDIIELQGEVHLQPAVKQEGQRSNESVPIRAVGGVPDSGLAPNHSNIDTDPAREGLRSSEILLGEVHFDRFNPRRCTLHMGTLRVDGVQQELKDPVLVLKRCAPSESAEVVAQIRWRLDREAKRRREKNDEEALVGRSGRRQRVEDASEGGVCDTVLFSDWIDQHPEYLSLDYLFFDSSPSRNNVFESADENACRFNRTGDDLSCSNALLTPNSVKTNSTTNALLSLGTSDSRTTAQRSAACSSGDGVVGEEAKSHQDDLEFVKDYMVVGLVENSLLFNTKPVRVFK